MGQHGWLFDLEPDSVEYNERLDSLLARGVLVRPNGTDMDNIRAGRMYRVNHTVSCKACRRPYADHPAIHEYAFLHKLCNGQLVKF